MCASSDDSNDTSFDSTTKLHRLPSSNLSFSLDGATIFFGASSFTASAASAPSVPSALTSAFSAAGASTFSTLFDFPSKSFPVTSPPTFSTSIAIGAGSMVGIEGQRGAERRSRVRTTKTPNSVWGVGESGRKEGEEGGAYPKTSCAGGAEGPRGRPRCPGGGRGAEWPRCRGGGRGERGRPRGPGGGRGERGRPRCPGGGRGAE